MLGKRQYWVPYTSFNPTVSLSLLWAWDVRMYSDPGAREDRSETTPHNTPDRPTMGEVGTTISRQRVAVDGRDGAGVDKGTLN